MIYINYLICQSFEMLYSKDSNKTYVATDETMSIVIFCAAIAFMVFGLIGFFFPRISWRLKLGWRARNSEPSDAVLIITRIVGIIGIVIGVLLLIYSNYVCDIIQFYF